MAKISVMETRGYGGTIKEGRKKVKEVPVNQIICDDAVEVLSTFPANSIDLVITSPPYDNLRDYKGRAFDFEGLATELARVLKQGGVIVWVVNDAVIDGSKTGTSFKQALYFKDLGLNLHDTMIYGKKGIPYPSIVRYYQVFDYMFILSKNSPKTFNPIKDRKNLWAGVKAHWGKPRWRQKDGSMKEVKDSHIIPEYSMRTNIYFYSIGKGNSTKDEIAYKHPAIFPEKLAKDQILSWSNEGDVVLDPMCGSGTTLKMASKTNRKWIGIDISEEYCEISRQRLELCGAFSSKLMEFC